MRVTFAVNAAPGQLLQGAIALASARYRAAIPARVLSGLGWDADLVGLGSLFDPKPDLGADVLVLHQPKYHVAVEARSFDGLWFALDSLARRGGRLVLDVCDYKFGPDHDAVTTRLIGAERAHRYRLLIDELHARCDALVVPTPALQRLEREHVARDVPIEVIDDPVEVAVGTPRFLPASPLRLLWFGMAASHPGLGGFLRDDLSKITGAPAVEACVVSEPLGDGSRKFLASAARKGLALRFETWSLPSLEKALALSDIVTLPFDVVSIQAAGKSANRAAQALCAGRYVAAHPLESYRPLAEFCGIGPSIAESIDLALATPEKTLARIEAGQAHVLRHFAAPVIGKRWDEVLRVVRASTPSRRARVPSSSRKEPERPARLLRILAASRNLTPTLQIHLLRPLRDEARIQIATEEMLQRLAEASRSRVEVANRLDGLLAHTTPQVVFSSRYNGALAEELFEAARRHSIPFVLHLDDNLLEVPPDQGEEKAALYGNAARLHALRVQIEGADVVYLSTPALRHRLTELGLRMRSWVGPVCAGTDPLPPPPVRPPGSAPVFGYAASAAHASDVRLALPGIVAALQSLPGSRFEMIGSIAPPAELAAFADRVRHTALAVTYDAYLAELNRRAWDLGIAPLVDTPFSRMKTYTKWVEYTAAGIATLASDHPVYRECCSAGAGALATDGAWSAMLPAALANPALRKSTLAAARAKLESEYSVERLRDQVLAVLEMAGVRLAA